MTLTVNRTVLVAGQAPTSLVVELPTDASGKVSFYDDQHGACEGGTSKATCFVLGIVLIDDGYATLTSIVGQLAPGSHNMYATYGGDGNYLANKSNVVTVTVKQPAPSGTAAD
jgi:Bacterial Ig-like domain (group 3)